MSAYSPHSARTQGHNAALTWLEERTTEKFGYDWQKPSAPVFYDRVLQVSGWGPQWHPADVKTSARDTGNYVLNAPFVEALHNTGIVVVLFLHVLGENVVRYGRSNDGYIGPVKDGRYGEPFHLFTPGAGFVELDLS